MKVASNRNFHVLTVGLWKRQIRIPKWVSNYDFNYLGKDLLLSIKQTYRYWLVSQNLRKLQFKEVPVGFDFDGVLRQVKRQNNVVGET